MSNVSNASKKVSLVFLKRYSMPLYHKQLNLVSPNSRCPVAEVFLFLNDLC